MYSILPNLVLAFHGCDRELGEAVIKGEERLKPSQNEYDWLGNGIYFWENSVKRARLFAERAAQDTRISKGNIKEPFVVGAVIFLGYCLNLTDPLYVEEMKDAYEKLKEPGNELPVNVKSEFGIPRMRKLDCAVIETLHLVREDDGIAPFDTVRGVFIEGDDIYPGAGFRELTHIQVCVRNTDCIKGYFHPQSLNT